MLHRIFDRVFGIRPDEFKLVQLFLLFLTLICASYTISSTAAITLFLSKLSEVTLHTLLPWIYMCNALTIALVVAIYQRLIDLVSRIKLITWTMGFFIISYACIWLLIKAVGNQVGLYFFLMIWVESCAVILLMMFYSYLGDYFYVHNGKRLYGYISGGMALGAPIGGFGAAFLLKYMPVVNLLFFTILLMAAANLVAWIIWKTAIAPRRAAGDKQLKVSNPILLSKIFSSKYLRIIFIATIVGGICTVIEVYQLFYIASQTFDEKALGNFMGKLFGYIGIAQFIINFVLAPWVLRHFGVLTSLLFLPILMIILSIGFIGNPSIAFAAAIKFVDATFTGSLYNISTQMLYLPLSERIRMHSQSIAIGIMGTSASVISSLILIVFSFYFIPIQYYSVVILVLASIWVINLLRLYPLYRRTLAASLAKIDSDPMDLQRLLASATAKPVIMELLKTGKSDSIIVVLESMTLASLKKIKTALKELLNHANELLVIEAIKIFAEFEDKKDIPLIEKYLFDDRPHIQAAAIYTYCRITKEKSFAKVAPLSESENGEVQEASLVNLYRYGGEQAKQFVLAKMQVLLHWKPLVVAKIITQIVDPIFENNLEVLLKSSNEQVQQQAIQASKYYPNEKIVQLLIKLLCHDKSLYPLVEESLFAMDATVLPEIEKQFYHGHLPEEVRYILLIVMGKIGDERSIPVILDVLASKNAKLLVGACRALSMFYFQRKLSLTTIKTLDVELDKIISILTDLKEIYSNVQKLSHAKAQLFVDSMQFYANILCAILSIKYGTKEMLNISKIIATSNKHLIASALEVLETMVSRKQFLQLSNILLSMLNEMTFNSESLNPQTVQNLLNVDPWVRSITLYNFPEIAPMTAEDNKFFVYIDVILFLKNVDLFRNISAHYLIPVAEIVQKQKYFVGELLVKEGDEGEALFIIKSGQVDIELKHKKIVTLGSGECVGELALLDHLPHSATARVVEDAEVYKIDAEDFRNVLETYPEVAEALLKILAGRLRTTTTALNEQSQG